MPKKPKASAASRKTIAAAFADTEANKIERTKIALKLALDATLGNITDACKKVGISRTTFYEYTKADPVFAQEVKDIEEAGLDYAESILKQKVMAGNMTAIIFFLKTKGKKRGYIEGTSLHNADGGNLFDWAELSKQAAEGRNLTDEDDPIGLLDGHVMEAQLVTDDDAEPNP